MSEKVFNGSFHGVGSIHQVDYTIRLKEANGVLAVSLTRQESADVWEGVFDEDFIENLTKKTGNMKSFKVFVKMLHSAFEMTSESVLLDVLTARDLELLRERKKRETISTGSLAPGNATLSSSQRIDDSKMFIILTYIVEFDKVHYPLSLTKSSPAQEKNHLVGMIESLRKELAFYKSQSQQSRLALLRQHRDQRKPCAQPDRSFPHGQLSLSFCAQSCRQ